MSTTANLTNISVREKKSTKNNEIWIPIKGFEGFYEISNFCNVKRLAFKRKTRVSFQPVKEIILKPYLSKVGYYVYDLRIPGKRKMSYKHRLIAYHFIDNPNNYKCVNHINGVKTDNRIENLEWCTYSQNLIHAIDNGLNKSVRKLNEKKVKEIKILLNKSDMTVKDIADLYNVSKGAITGIKYGINWKHVKI